jgi:hypothetical protein
MGLLDILSQYVNPSTAPSGNVMDHFDQVAQQAPSQDLGRGIAAAFRSDATPAFGQAVGGLFAQSNPQQQAGLLNQLVQSIGPGALAGIAGGVLGRMMGANTGGGMPSFSPTQASQLSPSDVSAIATHAQTQDDSVVDKVGGFYAAHPTLVKSLGAAALAVALGRMHSQT